MYDCIGVCFDWLLVLLSWVVFLGIFGEIYLNLWWCCYEEIMKGYFFLKIVIWRILGIVMGFVWVGVWCWYWFYWLLLMWCKWYCFWYWCWNCCLCLGVYGWDSVWFWYFWYLIVWIVWCSYDDWIGNWCCYCWLYFRCGSVSVWVGFCWFVGCCWLIIVYWLIRVCWLIGGWIVCVDCCGWSVFVICY